MLCVARASTLRAYWCPSAAYGCHRYSLGHGRLGFTSRMRDKATSAHPPAEVGASGGNPHACNIESHLSKEGLARNLSSLSKFIFSFSGIPGMVSLHGGLPNASIFPFKSMKVELQDGTWLDMSTTEKVCSQTGVPPTTLTFDPARLVLLFQLLFQLHSRHQAAVKQLQQNKLHTYYTW